jgi:hypothetical protein
MAHTTSPHSTSTSRPQLGQLRDMDARSASFGNRVRSEGEFPSIHVLVWCLFVGLGGHRLSARCTTLQLWTWNGVQNTTTLILILTILLHQTRGLRSARSLRLLHCRRQMTRLSLLDCGYSTRLDSDGGEWPDPVLHLHYT